MKQKLLLFSLATLGFIFANTTEIKAQNSPTPMFIDDVITVKRRSPKKINYKDIQKKIKKQKPKIDKLSTFECKAYGNYKNSAKGKREKQLQRQRKQIKKQVFASK